MYSGTDQVHIFKFITMKLLGLINDTYKLYYIILRQKRGTSSTMFNVTGFEQNMPQGNNWQEPLNNSEYKFQLVEMIKQYVPELGSGIPSSLLILSLLQETMSILFRLHEIKL